MLIRSLLIFKGWAIGANCLRVSFSSATLRVKVASKES
jgi:hypothetical protein